MNRAPASLRLGGATRAGEDRLRLLEAIDRRGSITAAGEEIGLGYRAAWDAVQALNNLFPKPLVRARAGGRSGGAAELTAEGEATLRTLRHIQAEITLAIHRLEARLAEDPAATAFPNPWSLIMRTSARNALRGRVKSVTDGAVNAEVVVDVGQGLEMVAIITRHSVEDLGIAVGSDVIALVKSSFVILVAGDTPIRTSARNRLAGTVVAHDDGAVNSEIALELADGKTLVATITRGSAESLGLKVGDRATALVKASHVILAVE
ncbi:MAG TPA: TOBE domain-containing protein [Caulobacteraceae bacterium]|nr:TOBE domain-containing protein [Caulobacteraceae bacterium]